MLCQLSYISKYNRLLRTCGLSARHLFILGLYLVNGWCSNPYFCATIYYTFGFAYHVAPLITTECFSITFNAFFCRASKAGTLSFRTMSYDCERLELNQRFPPYEGGEMTTSLLRNIAERIQLTYSTSRLFYQPNHIKLCCCYQQYLSRRNYSHIGFGK